MNHFSDQFLFVSSALIVWFLSIWREEYMAIISKNRSEHQSNENLKLQRELQSLTKTNQQLADKIRELEHKLFHNK